MFAEEDDRPRQRDVDGALKDWLMTTWMSVTGIIVMMSYPTTFSLFGIVIGLLFATSRSLWSTVMSLLGVIVSLIGNCFYYYSPFFINIFNIYPIPLVNNWQWIAGSCLAHALLLAVMATRVVVRSDITTSKMLTVLLTLRSRS